ncbi:Nuclear transcription factor Y subunit C-2 [Dictyocoela muelleri]|nr:Nuclear transcription factor Y subunit C-2 [Dictyocoela muelleri]
MNISNFKHRVKQSLDRFWLKTLSDIEIKPWHYKDLQLPLARIKRLMKVEEEVKMVASEVPILFAKITEIFIQELTLRAWINTEENKRRILQKNDLGAAVRTSDVYDFLIFIIPRNELEATFGEYNKFQDFENKFNNYFSSKNGTSYNEFVDKHDYVGRFENKVLNRKMINDELYRGKGCRDLNESLATDEIHAKILSGELTRNSDPRFSEYEQNKINRKIFCDGRNRDLMLKTQNVINDDLNVKNNTIIDENDIQQSLTVKELNESSNNFNLNSESKVKSSYLIQDFADESDNFNNHSPERKNFVRFEVNEHLGEFTENLGKFKENIGKFKENYGSIFEQKTNHNELDQRPNEFDSKKYNSLKFNSEEYGLNKNDLNSKKYDSKEHESNENDSNEHESEEYDSNEQESVDYDSIYSDEKLDDSNICK